MIIHEFCCEMRLVLSLSHSGERESCWTTCWYLPPLRIWDTLTCSQHDDDATQKPSQPPLAVAVDSGKTSKLLQEYGTIRWKSMTPEATWKHELWPWWTLKHYVKVPNVLSGAYNVSTDTIPIPSDATTVHGSGTYEQGWTRLDICPAGRNSSWSCNELISLYYKLPTSECHGVTTFNPEIPTIMITEAKILLQTADFPVSSQASQRMLWRSALKHDDIQETTQIHSAWSHNVNTALICTLSFLAFLVSSICPKALQTPVTVRTESQRTETQSTSEIFFRNRADPMKILLRPSISFNPSLERHLQYEKEDEGRLLEWNRDLTRLETSPNKWHTIWPSRVQEHCSIGILDPSDQDSSWCPHTRRTSVGGGKHIPENERNIPSGYLT